MRITLTALLVAAALLTTAPSGDAQSLRVRLVEEGSETPIGAAFVSLRDGGGRVVAGALSNGAGWALLQAAVPGTYRVRVERLGFQMDEVDGIALTRNSVLTRVLAIRGAPLRLEGISADVDRRCRGSTELSSQAARLWEETRKALSIAAFSGAAPYRYEVTETYRLLTPDLRIVNRSDSTRAVMSSGSPFESLPAEDLIAKGFIRPANEHTWSSFAPDAQTLISDEFVERTCFRSRDHPTVPDLIGLAWEPRNRPHVPWVTGTLWVRRADLGLSFIEFRFVELPWPVEAPHAGGEVHFRTLETGEWIVSSWWLRSPVVNAHRQVVNRVPVVTYSVRRYTEQRREVLTVFDPSGRSIPLSAR